MAAPSRTLKELFLAALEVVPADRAAWLDRECAGDTALRKHLRLMLAAHDEPQSLLDRSLDALAVSPAAEDAGPTLDHPATETPGTIIGAYKLLQQLGEGGMGMVWMAEQTRPVQRKVALKLIKPGMDSRQVVARFEAERQALAMMDHVNIARVFDGGATENGRPYFVMELVHGVPITKYCDDNHLTPRERLELFVPVCQAIQHAHQKGIIHRDVKPSNVMVTLYDGKPVPKVIDFGVAKATEQKLTERTLFTQYGTMIGTLEYMSPEQAEMSALGVDTRSDIYSLGVLLYELLTGSTPLTHKRMKEAAYGEILRMIKEEEPPRPSTRLSDSGEALATISAQRHTEPAKLTKLVRGELDWIVMKTLEKDRGRRYETAKDFATDVQRYLDDEQVQACPPSALYRFRKFARRNKTGIGVAGLVLFFMVLVGSGAGWALRDREAREQEIAQETARKLALTEQGIRQALDRGITSRADLHAVLNKPGGVQQLLNQPARWELFIKTVRGELTQARQLAVRAETRLDAEWTQAMDKLEQQLTSDQADYDLARGLERIRLDQATTVEGRFDFRTAADEYPKAFAGFGVLSDDPGVVAARIAASPIKSQLVAALDDWASIALFLRQDSLVEKLLALARQAAPDPTWGDRLRQLKVWRNKEALGELVAQVPAAGLSPQLLDHVGALLNRVDSPLKETWQRKAHAEHPADFWLNYNLAITLEKTNPLEAEGYCRVAIAVRPGNCSAYNTLGNRRQAQGKLDDAIDCYHKAIAIDPKYAAPYANLGLTLRAQGKFDKASAACRQAIALDPKFANAYSALGNILCDQKNWDDAITAYRKAIDLNPKYASFYYNLGLALHAQKKLNDAIVAYRKAIEIDPIYALAYGNLGLALKHQGKLDDAIDNYHKAIAIDPKYAEAHNYLGVALDQQKKFDKALAAYRNAIAIDPNHAAAHNNLGATLSNQGKLNEAIPWYRKAIELDPKHASAHNNLGGLASHGWVLANNPDPKFRDFKRAIELGKEAVKHVPQSGLTWQYFGWIQYRAGNWKASIEALEKSCKLQEPQEGSKGDYAQWIVMSLAHGRLAGEKDLPEQDRAQHLAEARRWYDLAVKQIKGQGWSHRPSAPVAQGAWDFWKEAEQLLGVKENQK